MLGKNAKLTAGAIFLTLIAVVLLIWSNRRMATLMAIQKGESKQVEAKGSETHSGNGEIAGSENKERIRARAERVASSPAVGRSKGVILREVRQVFGQAEAARAKKLAERVDENEANGSYLYVVEPPSKGEVQTVKARIADLIREVSAGDRAHFDEWLEDEIDSYDPYGEKGRKAMLITVPAERTGRMSGMIIEPGDLDELQKNFVSGVRHAVTARKGYFSSYDGKTLDRFQELMVWKPDEAE